MTCEYDVSCPVVKVSWLLTGENDAGCTWRYGGQGSDATLWSKYSDNSANEDNSFRNHIRKPKYSLAETIFPVGFYRKSFNSF